jgi:SAM-dependent methyltransferase
VIKNQTNQCSPQQAIESPRSDQQTLTVLHVGCGSKAASGLHKSFQAPGWTEVRLDLDPSVEPDIVASITDMAMVESSSIDAVFSSHNLEHLEAHEVPLALAEFFRVLRPGGMLLATMPDLQSVAKLIADDKLEETAYTSPAGPVTPLDILYGYRPFLAKGASAMAHRTGFTMRSLGMALRNAGFQEGQLWTQELDLWAMATRPEETSYQNTGTIAMQEKAG